jgi:hypothetical protein
MKPAVFDNDEIRVSSVETDWMFIEDVFDLGDIPPPPCRPKSAIRKIEVCLFGDAESVRPL